MRRLLLIAGHDLLQHARRSLFWIWALILVFFAWMFSTGVARIQSGDSGVGGVKSHMTSEFGLAMQLAILTALVYGFFTAVAAGMAIIQDEEYRVGELFHATGLRPWEYIWGKFLAVLGAIFAVLALHLLAMIVCNHVLPAGAAKEFRGPFHPLSYVRAALYFTVPTVVFMAGLAFAIGERTRKPVLVYFLPVATLLGSVFFLWEWSPSWLDPRIDRLLMLIDPAGFRWLNETLLKVDRGVDYYNSAPIPLDWWFAANRLIALGMGLGAVALSQRHFAGTLRGVSHRAERAWSRRLAEAGVTFIAPGHDAALDPRPLKTLGMGSRPPGLLSGAWTVARAEAVELGSSPGLYLFVPLLVLEAFVPNFVAVGAFDTPLLLTPGTLAVRSFGPLTVMTCLLLLFYTVESLWRERQTRLGAICMATPVRTGSLLLGKALANGMIAAAVVLCEYVLSTCVLLWQGKVGADPRPFLLVWGVLLIPTVLAWTAFVMATLSITRNRYLTYALCLAALIFTGYRQATGQINWAGNWALWNALQWSDISVMEFDRTAIVLNRLMVAGLALFLTALTARFYGRRDVDPIRLAHRLRPAPLAWSVLKLAPFAVVPLVLMATLWSMVNNGFQGEAMKRLQKDYWRKNLATYKDWPLPDITAVDLDVTLEPARGRLQVKGTYDLVNNRDVPLRQIPVTAGPHWEDPTWTLDGKTTIPNDRQRLFVFLPDRPIPPGGQVQIGFAFSGTFPGGVSKRGGGNNEFIVPSAVVLTSFGTSFAPVLGYSEGVGVDEENRYESREYPDDYFEGQTESAFGSRRPFTTRVKITGPADFTFNSVGTIASDEVKGGLRTTTWESDQPVNFLNIVAGRWEVKRGKGTAVFYSKTHPYNVDEMVVALDAAREFYSKWFRPYPWKELKLSEFPALAGYAQGFPTDITFSESIGFLTRSDATTNSAFMVTAHESAHQWWGNLIAPGRGPGGNLLSEGTSHFSTLLLFEQVKGLNARIEFARKIEDSYAKGRLANSERPLVKVDGTRDGDTTVTYDKTGFVLWMLLNEMGREPMLAGIRDFFDAYRDNPDHPVLQDFLAVLRRRAADPKAFDAFADQWFFKVVMPEFRLTEPRRSRDGDAWKATALLKNAGSGKVAVEVAAVKGVRFKDDGTPDPDYREARKLVTLEDRNSRRVTIKADFEPDRLVVDPDVKVLQLQRKGASARF